MGTQRGGVEQRKIPLVLSCQLLLVIISALAHLLPLSIGHKNSSSEGKGLLSKGLSAASGMFLK